MMGTNSKGEIIALGFPVYGVSITKKGFPATSVWDNCRDALGLVYNTIKKNPIEDKSYLQNIYFSYKDDEISKLEIISPNRFTLCYDQNFSLSDLQKFIDDHSDSILFNNNDIIKKTEVCKNINEFEIQNRYLPGSKDVILPNVFYMREWSVIKPASIIIEKTSVLDSIFGHRSSGIFFNEFPNEIFKKLKDVNDELELGYKINVRSN